MTILLAILAAFAIYIYGAQRLGWEFNELAALFFAVGVLAGLLGRLGLAAPPTAFVDGFRSMTLAALLVGFARAIYVVLNEGQIVDTIVHGLFTPIAGFPTTLAALGMMVVQAAIHVPVPSTSSQAVLTMPLLVPLSDLIGLSRQVTVLAYQYGAGLCDDRHPDEWRADGNAGGGGSALRRLAQVRDSACTPGSWCWRRSRWPWRWRSGSADHAGQVQLDELTRPSSTFMSARPTCRPFSFPPSKAMTVGIPRIPKREAVSGLASVSSLTTSASPARLWASSSSVGAMALQGPHQSA